MTNDWESRFEKRPVGTGFRLALLVLLAVAVLGGVSFVIKTVFYPVQQAGRVMERTLDADNMIYNYEWFKRQNADIESMQTKIAAAQAARKSFEASAGDRSTWTFDDKTEWSRLNSIELGLTNQRASMVAEYNSKASMANRSIFKSGDLPDKISQ